MEFETQKRILEYLKRLHPDHLTEIGKTGVMATFEGSGEGEQIMLRCDTDALPIQEINSFDHRSRLDGVSHKCGHDGHTTIMLGVAEKLSKDRPSKGKVHLVFQPAEENGEGAKAVIYDDRFKSIRPDFVFALHNLPGYPLHQIVIRNGSFTAAAKSIIVKLHGKTSHAAEPEKGINPSMAISEIINAFESLSVPDLDHKEFFLSTGVRIDMGELSYGVSAGYGEVHYTFRSWTNDIMEKNCEEAGKMAIKIANSYNLDPEISWTEEFFANQNDAKAVEIIERTIKTFGYEREERKTPFKWGEDFGLFTEKFPGAMFGIGSGVDCPALHNPDYDFPDEIINTGMNMFTGIINEILN
jgi:amidohydrolase